MRVLRQFPRALNPLLRVGDPSLGVEFNGFPLIHGFIDRRRLDQCGFSPQGTQELQEVRFEVIGAVTRM